MADQKFHHTPSFYAGWDAAIQEVSDAVAGYIALQKSGHNPDPWEEWLPRFLELVSEGDRVECRADDPLGVPGPQG